MRENEINSEYISVGQPSVRFVSDAEASRRIPTDSIDPSEVVETRGDFNSIDGTHPHSQAEADARDAAYLGRDKATE